MIASLAFAVDTISGISLLWIFKRNNDARQKSYGEKTLCTVVPFILFEYRLRFPLNEKITHLDDSALSNNLGISRNRP